MKAIVFDQFGDPSKVLQVREIPESEPGPGQVRVRMIASPINPSDLLYVQGKYGRQPTLPATPGFEGVGVVEKAGPGFLGWLRRQRRVAVLNSGTGNWQEKVIVPARQVIPVPASLPDEQAATFFVNPASAFLMTRAVLRISPGTWLVQTAAGSTLGRMVIRLGKHYGFRTINVVRRREQVAELQALGGDAVVCTQDESLEDRVRELTGGRGAEFAIDAVGGETGSAVIRSLGRGGRMLVYGTLSEEPLSVSPRTLMVGEKQIAGFWLSEWMQKQQPLRLLRLFRHLGQLIGAGILLSDIGTTFPMAEIQAAAREAAKPGRQGKVLIRLG